MQTTNFTIAFNLAMQSEIGSFFNPNDPAVIAGLIDTPAHRRAVGYVNVPGDAGGETKFGVAQNANGNVVVRTLTLQQALNIYQTKYWTPALCDNIPSPLSAIHFDSAVNLGVGGAAKILQTALGVTADGNIGPKTLAALAASDIPTVCTQYLNARQARYNAIVAANPSQAKFLAGWTNRVNALKAWLSTQ